MEINSLQNENFKNCVKIRSKVRKNTQEEIACFYAIIQK